jgi:hypothetical protein
MGLRRQDGSVKDTGFLKVLRTLRVAVASEIGSPPAVANCRTAEAAVKTVSMGEFGSHGRLSLACLQIILGDGTVGIGEKCEHGKRVDIGESEKIVGERLQVFVRNGEDLFLENLRLLASLYSSLFGLGSMTAWSRCAAVKFRSGRTGATGSSIEWYDVGAHDERIVGSGHDESEMAMTSPPFVEGIDVALA